MGSRNQPSRTIFRSLKKYRNYFDCLVHEGMFMQVNMQSDSIRAKIFYQRICIKYSTQECHLLRFNYSKLNSFNSFDIKVFPFLIMVLALEKKIYFGRFSAITSKNLHCIVCGFLGFLPNNTFKTFSISSLETSRKPEVEVCVANQIAHLRNNW